MQDVQADARLTDGNANIVETEETLRGPPKATIIRRAQSYSDFHDAVRAVLSPHITANEDAKNIEGRKITAELDFVDWYHSFEHDLLDSSHDEYT